MGKDQTLARQDELVVEEQVNIYGAIVVASAHTLGLSTELTLYGLGALEHLQRRERCGDGERRIEEGMGTIEAPGLCLDECSNATDLPDEAVDGIDSLV